MLSVWFLISVALFSTAKAKAPKFSSAGLYEVNVGLSDVDGVVAAFGDFNGDKLYAVGKVMKKRLKY